MDWPQRIGPAFTEAADQTAEDQIGLDRGQRLDVQRRLTALGFDTDGSDGRVGRDTQRAVRDFQRKVGISPADGYAGLKVLARLRQSS